MEGKREEIQTIGWRETEKEGMQIGCIGWVHY